MVIRLWLTVVVGGFCGFGFLLSGAHPLWACKTKGSNLSCRQVSSKSPKGVSRRPFPFWRVMSLRGVPPVQPNSISRPAMWPLVSVVLDWSEGQRTAVSTTKRWSRWFGRPMKYHSPIPRIDRSFTLDFLQPDRRLWSIPGRFNAWTFPKSFQAAAPRCRGWKLPKRCQRASSGIASHADRQHA